MGPPITSLDPDIPLKVLVHAAIPDHDLLGATFSEGAATGTTGNPAEGLPRPPDLRGRQPVPPLCTETNFRIMKVISQRNHSYLPSE